MTDQELRLPSFFPRVPKQCKDVAKSFFDCFTEASVYEAGGDPGVGRAALVKCQEGLRQYTACCEKHLTVAQRSTSQAPQLYLDQVKDSKAIQ